MRPLAPFHLLLCGLLPTIALVIYLPSRSRAIERDRPLLRVLVRSKSRRPSRKSGTGVLPAAARQHHSAILASSAMQRVGDHAPVGSEASYACACSLLL